MVIEREDVFKKKYSHELLKSKELNVVEDLIILFQPFQELTILISASSYVTSSVMLPAITRLLEVLQLYESKHCLNFINQLALDMKDNLETRTKTYFKNKLLLAATFMDPRFRSLKFIKDQAERDQALYDSSAYIKNIYNNKM